MTFNKGLETGVVTTKVIPDQLFLACRIRIHIYQFCATYKKGKALSIIYLLWLVIYFFTAIRNANIDKKCS